MPQAQTQARTTDSPLRIPLVTSLSSRDTTGLKDGRLVNCYAELDPVDGGYWIEKRFGFSAPVYSLTGGGRGMYLWETSPAIGALYVVAGSNLYKNGVLLSALTVPTAQFKFQQVRGVTPMLVMGDGKNAYYTDGTT